MDFQTKLSKKEEKEFNEWMAGSLLKGLIGVGDFLEISPDYDYRGFFADGNRSGSKEEHFTDKYKTPYHETFSNESKYTIGDLAALAGQWMEGIDYGNLPSVLRNSDFSFLKPVLEKIPDSVKASILMEMIKE